MTCRHPVATVLGTARNASTDEVERLGRCRDCGAVVVFAPDEEPMDDHPRKDPGPAARHAQT